MAGALEIDKIKTGVATIGEQYGVNNVFLFGSYARGEATENSDIDLRIDKGEIKGLIRLAGFQLALEELFGKKVDLLTTDSLDFKFLKKIEKEEILLYGNK